MICIDGVFCEGERGQFRANADMIGWKSQGGAEAQIHECGTVTRAEWLNGKFRVQFCASQGEDELLALEGFGERDLPTLQQYFESYCGIHIKCWSSTPIVKDAGLALLADLSPASTNDVQSRDEVPGYTQPQSNSMSLSGENTRSLLDDSDGPLPESEEDHNSPLTQEVQQEATLPRPPQHNQNDAGDGKNGTRKIRVTNLRQLVGNESIVSDDASSALVRSRSATLIQAETSLPQDSQQTNTVKVLEGWVWKQSRFMKKWRRRWMTVTQGSIEWQARAGEGKSNALTLYFLENLKQSKEETTETVDIEAVVDVVNVDNEPTAAGRCFSVNTNNKSITLICDSAERKAEWMNHIQTVRRARKLQRV